MVKNQSPINKGGAGGRRVQPEVDARREVVEGWDCTTFNDWCGTQMILVVLKNCSIQNNIINKHGGEK